MSYSCQCPCGTNEFEIQVEPLVRFFCHCTICQRLYDSPSVDITLYKAKDLQLPDEENIEYGQHKRFMAVDRGMCKSCNKPAVSKMGEGDKQYVFVATRNYRNPEDLPPPQMHLFYKTRVADVDDNLPKHKGAIGSFLAIMKHMK